MVKTNRSTLHMLYNIQQSATQDSNHDTNDNDQNMISNDHKWNCRNSDYVSVCEHSVATLAANSRSRLEIWREFRF